MLPAGADQVNDSPANASVNQETTANQGAYGQEVPESGK